MTTIPKNFVQMATDLKRADYCDEARADGLVADDADISHRIAAGIEAEYAEIWYFVAKAIVERAAVIDPGDADDDAAA